MRTLDVQPRPHPLTLALLPSPSYPLPLTLIKPFVRLRFIHKVSNVFFLFFFSKELQALLKDVDLLLWKEMGHEAYVRVAPFFSLWQGEG